MDSQASTPTAAAAARVSKSAQRSAKSASGSSPQRMSRKRSLSTANGDTLGSSGSDDTITHNYGRGSKGHKVSRACDHCKQRKAKCSGTIPCATCSSRGLTCLYAARYSRGRPPTPPPSRDHHPTAPVRHVDALSLSPSDHLFCVAAQLTDAETGSPRLESAQARIIQTLYLLTTSRFNRAWYTFGNGLQIISALGLHRKSARKRQLTSSPVDYIQSQFRVRTFWTAYILDKYLGVIFGRPRHYHDDDIDQVLPDKIDDDDMTAQGPIAVGGEQAGAAAEALIFHIKIAQIISKISREVYSIKPISEEERISAAHRLSQEVHEWKESLPPYLGSIHPSMLVPSFRRKSIVLKLGYSHAIMHANRLFLLATVYPESETQIAECLGAARSVFETVDGLAAEGPIFHAFWWTQYVTFCALVISYVWDIQLKRRGVVLVGKEQAKHTRLMELARRCQTHLAKATATNSPSRRYAVILEEFRSEAMGIPPVPGGDSGHLAEMQPGQAMHSEAHVGPLQDVSYYQLPGAEGLDVPLDPSGQLGYSLLDEWHTTDWLDLDSSAFGPYMDFEPSSLQWMPDIGI
ncbi:Activator of stress genes protein 1 like [Verticillium longisporum]|nr:Activator of stress genes protein 1 like [Verticillium longisporum]